MKLHPFIERMVQMHHITPAEFERTLDKFQGASNELADKYVRGALKVVKSRIDADQKAHGVPGTETFRAWCRAQASEALLKEMAELAEHPLLSEKYRHDTRHQLAQPKIDQGAAYCWRDALRRDIKANILNRYQDAE